MAFAGVGSVALNIRKVMLFVSSLHHCLPTIIVFGTDVATSVAWNDHSAVFIRVIKKARIFSLLQVVHLIKANRRKTIRIIANSTREFQHSSLFFLESAGRQFLHVMSRYPLFTCG